MTRDRSSLRTPIVGCAVTRREREMTRQLSVVLYVVVMITLIVSLDVLFFRHLIWERLFVNIAIVLAFGASYLIVLKNLWR